MRVTGVMVRPGLACQLRRALLAFCLVLLAQVGQAAAGNVRLSWDANTEETLAGYVLVYGTASRVYTKSVTLPASAETHEVTNLPDGTYYFAVRAFDTASALSGYSNEVRVVVGSTSEPEPELSITSLTPTTGTTAGGTTVRISGTSFRTGAIVSFGGIAAVVTAQSSTSLTVRTPAGSDGEVALTVTNTDGETVTMESAFTYATPTVPVSTPTIFGGLPGQRPLDR